MRSHCRHIAAVLEHQQYAAQAPLLEIHELPNYEIGVTFKYTEEVKESLKETFAASDGRAWDPDLKMWRFPVELQEEVKEWALSLFDESEIRFPGQASFCLCSCFTLEVLICFWRCLAVVTLHRLGKAATLPQTWTSRGENDKASPLHSVMYQWHQVTW